MPAIGPVYQPTTYHVGYEPQSEWPQQPRRNRFAKFVDWSQSDECYRRVIPIYIVMIIVCPIIFFVKFIISSQIFGDCCSNVVYSIIVYTSLTLVVLGTFLILGLICLRLKRHQPLPFSWPFSRPDSLARQMGNQCRNGQAMVLNPSTDLLVTPAQYGPVMEAPPTMHEEDETRNLMSSDTKEEHEDRSADTDPRIVLRPPGHRDDL